MNTLTSSRPIALVSRVRRTRRASRVSTRAARTGLVAAALAVLSVMGATAASATTWSGGQTTTSGAACNTLDHSITVSAWATQMSAYTNGQYIKYQIQRQDITYSTSGSWVTIASWSPWQLVNGTVWHDSYLTGPYSTTQVVRLGTTTRYGTPGHVYLIRVQYDWWVGSDAVGTDPSTIYSNYSTYGTLPGGRCFT